MRNENYWGEKALLDEVNVSLPGGGGRASHRPHLGPDRRHRHDHPRVGRSLKSNKDIEVLQTKGTRLIHLFYNFASLQGTR